MKHNPSVTANAAGLTTAIVFVVCRVLVGLFPDLFFSIAQSWFHGIALNQIGLSTLNFSTFLLGLISSTATTWLIGYLFASLYNFFLKK